MTRDALHCWWCAGAGEVWSGRFEEVPRPGLHSIGPAPVRRTVTRCLACQGSGIDPHGGAWTPNPHTAGDTRDA